MRLGFLNFITFGIAGLIQRAVTLMFPIVTLILQMDSAKINKINNDISIPYVGPKATPATPVTPAKPATPVTPVKPATPDDPAVPVNPSGPVTPSG